MNQLFAHGLPIQMSDPNREVELAYIDDVVAALLAELDDTKRREQVALASVQPVPWVCRVEMRGARNTVIPDSLASTSITSAPSR